MKLYVSYYPDFDTIVYPIQIIGVVLADTGDHLKGIPYVLASSKGLADYMKEVNSLDAEHTFIKRVLTQSVGVEDPLGHYSIEKKIRGIILSAQRLFNLEESYLSEERHTKDIEGLTSIELNEESVLSYNIAKLLYFRNLRMYKKMYPMLGLTANLGRNRDSLVAKVKKLKHVPPFIKLPEDL